MFRFMRTRPAFGQGILVFTALWWSLLRVLVFTAILEITFAFTPCQAEGVDPAAIEFFERDIRPLLAERCYECHGDGDAPKGGLRLTSRAAILAGGDSGPAAVPGKPAESLLIDAVGYESTLQMPPKEKLSQPSVDRLAKWIALGLPWPEEASTERTPKASRPFRINEEHRKFWSFQPLGVTALPPVRNVSWPRGEIDRFILAKLENHGLSPAASASKRVLLRRATYDLTGLPPTPEELDSFAADESPEAFAKVVDRLLASPAYGERWGRHWLDVVRYADSRDARYVGAGHDITEAWRYRDWVIRAMNRDLPYSDFIVHQVAGDLLPATAPGEFNAEGLVATGFLAIGEWGTGDSDAQKMHTDMVDDQINVVSRAFLGLTLGCARCHDHKFDPISTADYYALAGIFFSTQIATPQTSAQMVRVPLVPPAEVEKYNQCMAAISEKEKVITQFTDEQYGLLVKSGVLRTAEYLMAAWDFRHRLAEKATLTFNELATERGLRSDALGQWLEYLGWTANSGQILTSVVRDFAGQQGVYAWKGSAETPVVAFNSNDVPVAVPGTLPPRSIAVHPSPQGGVAIGWQSPLHGSIQVTGRVGDAHVGCGDGVDWVLEQCRPDNTLSLASGSISEGASQTFGESTGGNRLAKVEVQPGEILRLVIQPKANHGCDMTTLELEIRELGGEVRIWNVTQDLIAQPLGTGTGNPRADAYGNRDTWGFYDCPLSTAAKSADRSLDSPLGAWFTATAKASPNSADRVVAAAAANEVQRLLAEVAKNPPPVSPAGGTSDATAAAAKLYQELISAQGPYRITKRDHDTMLPADALKTLKSLNDELESLRRNAPPPLPMALVAREGGVPGTKYAGFNDANIHVRGRYDLLGAVVPRRFPEVLAGGDQPRIAAGSGRLELGRWLARAENPLTARVIVNRIWQHHFGAGLVRTPGNFGTQGDRPTHRELLDFLAQRLVESGWSLKSMHRMIMLSAVYQQASSPTEESLRVDPDNRLLSRANIRRLEAEAIRDTMLSVAGTLDRTMGGPSIPAPANQRRALYSMTIRSVKSGFSFLFDVADPEIVVDQRTTSTVAPQSLFLMNNEFVLELASALAERICKDSERGADKAESNGIALAYGLLYGRDPLDHEIAVGQEFIVRARQRLAGESQGELQPDQLSRQAWAAYCQTLLCANELIYLD